MFHSARWKAYLQDLQNKPEKEDDDNIYHILHSQKIWFTRHEDNGLQKAAEEHLKRSDDMMKDCSEKMDNLEETLANTPKPSEMLNWDMLTLQDLT